MVECEIGGDNQFRGTYMAAQEETPGGVVVRVRCKLGSTFHTNAPFVSCQLTYP